MDPTRIQLGSNSDPTRTAKSPRRYAFRVRAWDPGILARLQFVTLPWQRPPWTSWSGPGCMSLAALRLARLDPDQLSPRGGSGTHDPDLRPHVKGLSIPLKERERFD